MRRSKANQRNGGLLSTLNWKSYTTLIVTQYKSLTAFDNFSILQFTDSYLSVIISSSIIFKIGSDAGLFGFESNINDIYNVLPETDFLITTLICEIWAGHIIKNNPFLYVYNFMNITWNIIHNAKLKLFALKHKIFLQTTSLQSSLQDLPFILTQQHFFLEFLQIYQEIKPKV